MKNSLKSVIRSAGSLYEKVDKMYIQLLKDYWNQIVNNTVHLHKQDDTAATEWPERKSEDGEIGPAMTVEEAEWMVRAMTHPYPGAFYYHDDKKIIIWRVHTSESFCEGVLKFLNGYLVPDEYDVVEEGEH